MIKANHVKKCGRNVLCRRNGKNKALGVEMVWETHRTECDFGLGSIMDKKPAEGYGLER